MTTLKLKCLTRPCVLKRIGRGLLTRFFEQFAAEMSSSGLALPPPDSSDADYFNALARILMRPEELPDALSEALVAIDDLSTPQGFESLEKSPGWAARQPLLEPESTREDIALQLWLADRDFVIKVHNQLRLRRLTVFEYASHPGSGADCVVPATPSSSGVRRQTECDVALKAESVEGQSKAPSPLRSARALHSLPDKSAILDLTFALDHWFATNHRGSETTKIEVYPLRGEFWFLIRHGDVFIRAPKVRQQTTEILHYRPERDDVVVYSPALDEIRVNARTQGERELYIQQFGLHLRGSLEYFSHRAPYTLEPLRAQGESALDPEGLKGISSIVLRELEFLRNGNQRETITRHAEDVFQCAPFDPRHSSPIPDNAHLARAIFDIQFAGARKAHPVEIRLPNILKVSRRCDPHAIQDWLIKRGFRKNAPQVVNA